MFDGIRIGRKKSNDPFDTFALPYTELVQAIEDTHEYITTENRSASEVAFQKAAEKYDETHELVAGLMDYYIESEQYQVAYESLQNIQETYDAFYELADYFSVDLRELSRSTSAGIEALKGLLLTDMGKYRMAIKAFDTVLEINDSDVNAWVGKGQALFALDNYQSALEVFETALSLDWHCADAWKGKGDALLYLEEISDALEAYSTALELDETNVELYFKQALCQIALDKYQDCLRTTNELLKFDENNAIAWYLKYSILDHLGEEQSSLIAHNKALKIDPDIINDPFIESIKEIMSDTNKSDENVRKTCLDSENVGFTTSTTNIERTTTSACPPPDFTQSPEIIDVNLARIPTPSKTKKPIPYKKGQGEIKDDSPRGFACVAGMEELKERLKRDVIQPLKNPEKYKKFKVSIPNGILFYGPPGCGKTFIVRKLAEELGFTFIEVHNSSIGSSYMHGTAQNIAAKFQEAVDHAPTILFFDEIEGMVPNRENISSSESHKQEEINEFLTQLNNASKNNVLVIGATNQPDLIDSAIMRSGRMDKRVYIPPPDHEARKALFKVGLVDRPCASDIDIDKLAKLTENYASSDISLIVEESARAAVDLDRDEIDMEILQWKVGEIKPSLVKSQIAKYKQFEHLER